MEGVPSALGLCHGGCSQANLPKQTFVTLLALTTAALVKGEMAMYFQFVCLELDCLASYLDHPFVVIFFFPLATLNKN